MIAAFADAASVRAGEDLDLCVSNDIECRLWFVRAGRQAEWMVEHAGHRLAPCDCPPGAAGDPWQWPAHRFTIPQHWRSGVYIAVFARDGPPTTVDARSARALFVVLPARPRALILYDIPLFTYHAYNVGLDRLAERTCLYNSAPAVTLRRPGGGIGGHTWDEAIVDVYDPSSPRQTFAHWDWPAIAWLESRGYEVEYCTDLDLHSRTDLLGSYRLLLGFGHHEYWSDAMRAALTRHLAHGGNAAWFTGNTCYFRVTFDHDRHAISRLGRWTDAPEEETFGASYRFGGGKWRGPRPATGYRKLQPKHWVFHGTNGQTAAPFGSAQRLAGYECDGAPARRDPAFMLLAQADLGHWPVHDGSGELTENAHASITIREEEGTLFSAGTVDWPRVLAAGEPSVTAITSNVLRRLRE